MLMVELAKYGRWSGSTDAFVPTPQVGYDTFVSARVLFPGESGGDVHRASAPSDLGGDTAPKRGIRWPSSFDFRTGPSRRFLFPLGMWPRLLAAEMRRTAMGKGNVW